MVFDVQIRGIIAWSILLSVIPFSYFVIPTLMDNDQIPAFSKPGQNIIVVEIVDSKGTSGIYFVPRSLTLSYILRRVDTNVVIDEDVPLNNGESIRLHVSEENNRIALGQIDSEKRLALGMPLDVNEVSFDELMLVPGIGKSTARKIVDRRREIGGFRRLEDLMGISGIKQKKYKTLSQYLYVSANRQEKKKMESSPQTQGRKHGGL